MRRDLRWLAGLLFFPLRLTRPLQVLCLLAALMVIPSFWRDAQVERHDPQLLLLARMELSYSTALAQVASELPPASVPPSVAATHGQAYPRLPLLLHAAAWSWGGLPGLLAADLLVAVLGYCLWCALFRMLTGNRCLSLLWAAATVNGTAAALLAGLRELSWRLYFAVPHAGKALLLAAVAGAVLATVWQARRRVPLAPWLRALLACLLAGWIVSMVFNRGFAGLFLFRFPRPFVTGLFSQLWLLALLMVWRQPRRRLPEILTGLMAGLDLQSDLYTFGALGLTTAVVWVVRRKLTLRKLAAVLIPFVLAAAPFALHLRNLSPEMKLRMGLQELPRAAVGQIVRGLTGPLLPLALAFVAMLAACLLVQPRHRRQTIWVFAFVAVAMAASPALLVGVAGRAAQIAHYFYLIPLTVALFAWAALGVTAGSLWPRRPGTRTPWCAWAGAVAFGTGAAFLPHKGQIYGSEIHFPRPEFAALVSELRQPRYEACRVLGTWEPEVRAWWLAFHGEALNPDPFATSLPEAELERRVLRLAQVQEMTPAEFTARLRRADEIPTSFWQLGHFKYQVWRWFTVAPWSDYSRPEQDEENDFMLPNSTIERIAAAYPGGAAPLPCDLLVRVRSGEKVPAGFGLTWENGHYQVLRREPFTIP